MSRQISTEIVINATKQNAWKILIDFPSYPKWNRFLLKVNGLLIQDALVRFTFEMPRGFRAPACAKILKINPENELRWAGGIRGLFRAEHYFLIDPINESTIRFRHGEIFTGLLVPIVWRLLLARGGPPVYEAMNIALKKRAENFQADH